MEKLGLSELIDLAIDKNIRVSRKDTQTSLLDKLRYEYKKYIYVPKDIIRYIYSYYKAVELLETGFRNKPLWQIILKRDFNVIDNDHPFETYIQQSQKQYKKDYSVIFEYLIRILLEDKYEFHLVEEIELTNGVYGFGDGHLNRIIYKNYSNNELIESNTADFLNRFKHDQTQNNNEQNDVINVIKDINTYKLKLLHDNDKQEPLIDDFLTELILINTAGYNEDKRSHMLNNDEYTFKYISLIDEFYWNKYKGYFKITNLNGITIYDLIYGIFMIKSSKYDKWYELFSDIVDTHVTSLPNYRFQLTIYVDFDHGS